MRRRKGAGNSLLSQGLKPNSFCPLHVGAEAPTPSRKWRNCALLRGLGKSPLLRPARKFENIGAPMGASAVLFPAANSAERSPVTPGVIVASQIIIIRQSQHGGAVVHVEGPHGVCQRLILTLLGQRQDLTAAHP